MKFILLVLVVLLAVILFALFGPSKPQPAATPGQPTTAAGQQPATTPAVQAQPKLSPRQQGELSTPVAATGVTLETVNQGSGGATFEAKRRMTDKLQNLGAPDPKKKKR